MKAIGPEEVHKLIKQLELVRDRAVEDKNAIIQLYSSVDPKHDARITAFSKLINILNSVQLALTFISKHLLHKEWWDSIANEPISDADKQIYANEFANLIKVAFVHGAFSAVESSLRLFLRALDPIACNGGMAEFKSIYDCLFKSKLATEPIEGSQLLDLLRLVRNTIHNNGVYFSSRGSDARLIWNGQTYEFYHGKPVDFVTWEFLINISDALRRLLREIAEDANMKAIKAEITDPFSIKNGA